MKDALAALKALPPERFLDCIHCGLCLDSCPTYVITGSEADSPRGRIYFMRALAEGRAEPVPQVLEHLDRCLDCRACQTACPSGVQYGLMIEAGRELVRDLAPRSPLQKCLRGVLILRIISNPKIMKLALAPARAAQRLGLMPFLRRIPGILGRLARLLPDLKPVRALAPSPPRALPDSSPHPGPLPQGEGTAALLTGCAMDALYPGVNVATLSVLGKLGLQPGMPEGQVCCGAVALHSGDAERARAAARTNIKAFEKGGWPEVIVSNAAGCGLVMKEYGALLKDDPAFASRAQEFSKRVRDFWQVAGDGLKARPGTKLKALPKIITLHEPCHQVHGQGIKDEPRAVLKRIPGLVIKEMKDSAWCCGAAGTYNLTHPEFSDPILAWKVARIKDSGAPCVVAGNPPCMAQIEMGLREGGVAAEVIHPAELLDQAL